jgi:hypothetical protein
LIREYRKTRRHILVRSPISSASSVPPFGARIRKLPKRQPAQAELIADLDDPAYFSD